MPTYRPLKISVALKAAEIGSTATLIPAQHTKTRTVPEFVALDKAFINGTHLIEKAAPPPNMSGVVNFIGDGEEVPFLMVHAGADLFQPQPPERSSAVEKALVKLRAIRDANSGAAASQTDARQGVDISDPSVTPKKENRKPNVVELPVRTSKPDSSPISSIRTVATPRHTPVSGQALESSPERPLQLRSAVIAAEFLEKLPKENDILLAPMGLAVVIDISRAAFATSFLGGKEDQDVKIEVFVNGELAECVAFAGSKLHGNRKLVIHGRRVSRAINRPWIIIPPTQTAEGRLIEQPRKYAAPEIRWQLIADALAQESANRGTDAVGNRPPSAEYLRALARIGLPEEVHNLSRSNPISSNRFGVIDVVFTLGVRKPTPTVKWAYEPERLPDPRYSVSTMQSEFDNEPSLLASRPPQTDDVVMTDAAQPPMESVKVKRIDTQTRDALSTGNQTSASSTAISPPLPAVPKATSKRRPSDAVASDYSGESSRPASAAGSRAGDTIGISRRGVIRRGSRTSLHETDSSLSQISSAAPLQQLAPMNVHSVTFLLGNQVVLQKQLSQPRIVVRSRAGTLRGEQPRQNLVFPLPFLPTLTTLDPFGTFAASPQSYRPTPQPSFKSSPIQPIKPQTRSTQTSSAVKPPQATKKQQQSSFSSPTKKCSPTKPTPRNKNRRTTSTPGLDTPSHATASANLTWASGPLTKTSLVSYALPGPYIKGIAEGSKSIVGGRNADGSPCGVYRPVRLAREGGFAELEVLVGFRFLIG